VCHPVGGVRQVAPTGLLSHDFVPGPLQNESSTSSACKSGLVSNEYLKNCWILTGRFTSRAQMDGMKVSDSLSDVACSLSYIYLAVE
jgi:hypothetical protein